MKLSLLSDGSLFPVEVEESTEGVRIRIAGEPLSIDMGSATEPSVSVVSLLSLILGGQSYEAQVHVGEGKIFVELDGERFVFELGDSRPTARGRRSHGGGGPAEVRAPMPGKVVKLLVVEGDSVEAGQGLLLFEAMKMQNEIRSPQAGRVVAVKAQEGQAVEARDVLMTLQG